MSQQNHIPASFYKNFSTETLESMLRDMTLSEQDLDMEQLDAIMAELDHRTGAVETMPPEEAWEMFHEEYSENESGFLDCAYEETEPQTSEAEINAEITPNHKRTRMGLRVVIVAATLTALIFGSMIIAQAAGADVFGAIANWTNEIFGFGNIYDQPLDRESTEIVWPEVDIPSDTEFSSLQEALDAYGIDFEIAEPTWLPEGYEFESVTINYNPSFPDAYFYASYRNKYNAMIAISFQSYVDTPAAVYEKNDAEVEEYTIGNITYYVFSNEKTEKVAWTTDHFECCIYGHVTRDVIKAIAESIYH